MNKNTLSWILRFVVFALFIVSALAKMFPIWAFEKQLIDLGIASWDTAPYFARFLLGVELAIGVAILQPHYLKRIVIPATVALLVVFCIHLSIEMVKHGAMNGNCGCFGQLIPMTPLEAFLKNVATIGILIWLYKMTTEKEMTHRFSLLLLIWSMSSLVVFAGFPFSPKSETAVEPLIENTEIPVQETPTTSAPTGTEPLTQKKDTVQTKVVEEGPARVVSTYSKYAVFNGKKANIDEGKAIVCFFAPGCDHCQATAIELAKLAKQKDFPPVYIFFMDEEPEKIPGFISATGKNIPYRILDIPTFWTIIGDDGETPGVHYMWNGNIRKTFMGINERAFNAAELKKAIAQKK
ncbi:MAG: putative thiol:disulfide oxidoreductase TlpB [Bacteroidota bacterium]|jgi:thiol-disulfide isomerase/thioredoxin